MSISLPTSLQHLPATLPTEGAVSIELELGIPIFRASAAVQAHIEELLAKQQTTSLTLAETQELDAYEEMDDYISFINRMLRNVMLTQASSES